MVYVTYTHMTSQSKLHGQAQHQWGRKLYFFPRVAGQEWVYIILLQRRKLIIVNNITIYLKYLDSNAFSLPVSLSKM